MENNNWPDEVRLKMIEKSEFYPDDQQVYQYGFYDGYQYASQSQINLREELIKFTLWTYKDYKYKELSRPNIEKVVAEYLKQK